MSANSNTRTCNNATDARRVLIVANSFEHLGGVECRTLELIQYLKCNGWDPSVILLREIGSCSDVISKYCEVWGLTSVYEYNNEAGKIKLHYAKLLKLTRFLSQKNFKYVLAIQAPSHYLVRIASVPLLWRCPRIVIMERAQYRSDIAESPRSKKLMMLDRVLSFITYRAVCVSSLVAQQLKDKTGWSDSKVWVVENGASVDLDATIPECYQRLLDGSIVVGFCGNLVMRKRVTLLIDAISEIVTRRVDIDIKLLLVGEDIDNLGVVDYVEKIGMGDKVIFAGYQKCPDAFYRMMDIFAFPSVNESFGTVWVEALQHGLPVVLADLPPMSDYIVNDKTGLLFQPDNLDSLVKCIETLIDNPHRREILGRAAKAYSTTKFNRDTQIKKLLRSLTCQRDAKL